MLDSWRGEEAWLQCQKVPFWSLPTYATKSAVHLRPSSLYNPVIFGFCFPAYVMFQYASSASFEEHEKWNGVCMIIEVMLLNS